MQLHLVKNNKTQKLGCACRCECKIRGGYWYVVYTRKKEKVYNKKGFHETYTILPGSPIGTDVWAICMLAQGHFLRNINWDRAHVIYPSSTHKQLLCNLLDFGITKFNKKTFPVDGWDLTRKP